MNKLNSIQNGNSLLKVCPFCGGKAQLYEPDYPAAIGERYAIICTECGASTHTIFQQKGEAIRAWNRRTQLENKPLSLEELRKMNQRAIWWWNKSAQAQLTICSFKQFDKTPNFISFDWNEQDCTEAFSYEKLIRYGYKPYAHKPEMEEK